MFTGNMIVIDHQYAKLMRMQNILLFFSAFAIAFDQRDSDSKRRSFILFTIHCNRSVHQLNDAPGNCHTKACTSKAACSG